MCRHQTLFYDDQLGYIIRCTACENFQLGYGNLLITLNAVEFESFQSCIHKSLELYSDAENRSVKCIFIPTPCEGLKMMLSKNELADLNKMLDSADTEWKSQQLLELFSTG